MKHYLKLLDDPRYQFGLVDRKVSNKFYAPGELFFTT